MKTIKIILIKEYTMEKRQSLSKWCWESWPATSKSMKSKHIPTPHTKINSKNDQRPKYKTWHHKTPRRKHRQNISDIFYQCFLRSTPKAIEIKAKINKWDWIKLTSFAQQRKLKRKQNTTYRMGEKRFT